MKFVFAMLLFALSLASAQAQTSFRLVSQMERTPLPGNRNHIQGWLPYDVSFFPMVEYYTNFPAARPVGTTANLNVPLDTTFPAGTYDLWVAMATQGTNLLVRGQVGTGTVPDREYGGNPTWNRIGSFTSTTSFAQVSVSVVKLLPAGVSQNVWFGGVGIMPTSWQRLGEGINRWADFVQMPPAPESSRSTGNLIPNSSFEFGLNAHGWTSGRNGAPTSEPWLANMTSLDAFDGSRSAIIGDGPGTSRYSVRSPVIWLRGDKTERQYTLSFYHKRKTGSLSRMQVAWGMVYGNPAEPTNSPLTTAIVPLSPTWQRFSTTLNLKPSPNRLFQVTWSHISTTDTVLIDAVQLEEGTEATSYKPSDAIECSLTLNRNGNILSTTEPRTVTVQTFNDTASVSNVVFHYEAFDWMNRRVAKGTNAYRSEPGLSSRPLNLTTTNVGLTRMFAWLEGSPATRAELVFSVNPLPTSPSLDIDSLFGQHGPAQTSVIKSNTLWGVPWQRGLSPAGILEWHTVEPVEDVFIWGAMDTRVNSQVGNCIILGNLSSRADIPLWAQPGGVLNIPAWSNYVYQVVNRYKNKIRYWEDINEPSWSATDFAPILTATAGAVKAADPTAYFVGFGGISKSKIPGWAPQVWGLLSPTTRSQIDALSVHSYPSDGDDSGIDSMAAMREWTGKPIWNTETGVWGWGDYKGDRTGGPVNTVSYAEHWEEYQYIRTVWINPTAQARNWIRCLGRGMTKYFLYDARLSTYDWATENTNPTWHNYDDALNGIGSAYLWSKRFIDKPVSITSPTNTVRDPLAFVFGKPNETVLVVFSRSNTNYAATVSDSSFTVYDLMGNVVQANQPTVTISKIPRYWVSNTLTPAQMHTLFATATIAQAPDTTPPAISIDVSPHGLTPIRDLPLRFRWTVVDDLSVNTDENPSVVSTRYRLNGLTDWSNWGPRRAFELPSIPPGTSFLEIQARDAAGNLSEIVSGPTFGLAFGEAQYQAPAAPTNVVVEPVR
jgi:hypothetical protein